MSLLKIFKGNSKNYITNLIGSYFVITTNDNICISSSDNRKLGKKIPLPYKLPTVALSQSFIIKDEIYYLIPLRYNSKTVAVLATKNQDQVKQYLPLIKSFAELSIKQHFDQSKPAPDSTDQFVNKLLQEKDIYHLESYHSMARTLGYNLRVERLALLVNYKDFWSKQLHSLNQAGFERQDIINRTKKRIESCLNGFFTTNHDLVTAYLGDDRFIVFKATTKTGAEIIKKRLKNSFKSIFGLAADSLSYEIILGMSNSYKNARGLIDACEEARLALDIGTKISASSKCHDYNDLGLLQILADGNNRRQAQFVKKTLNQLNSRHLEKTLETFLAENLNLAETARKLHIHRNTALYRLSQINETLGLDPRNFNDALTLKTALLIKKFLR